MSDFWDIFSTPGQTQTQTNSADAFSTPYWQQYLSGLNTTLGQNPITPYGGPTVAPTNAYQNTAANMMYQFATNGTPTGNAANTAIQTQAQGTMNPYANATNPYQGQTNAVAGQTNPFANANNYMNSVVDQSNSRIADAFAKGTAAQTDAAFNQAGAYGGSAYNDMVHQNQQTLTDQLAANTNNLMNQNYYANAQMAGQDLDRNANIYGQDLSRNASLGENQLNRATNAFDTSQGRTLSAAQLGLASQGVDQNAIQGLNTIGTQQQGNTQDVLNAMQNYYTQSQLAPFTGYDLMGNALSRYSAANNQSSMQGPGTSGVTNLAGIIAFLTSLGLG